MKKNYFLAFFALALVFFGTLQAFAADYTISFTGSGKSTTVGSVEAQNVTKGTSVTVPGGEVLVLNVINTAVKPLNSANEGLRITSSVAGSSNVSFYAAKAGNASINVYSMDGRRVAAYAQNLQKGTNTFKVSLRTGAYVISVQGAGYAVSGKLISVSDNTGKADISFQGVEETKSVAPLKSTKASISLDYAPGDIMLYKGISGNYATIVTDKPTSSKTVNFNFIECKDASGNYYATVKIGSQIWMAENLNTAKYNDGSAITNITVAADWGNTALVTGAWCYWKQNPAKGVQFGKLYNWFAVNDARGIAPIGWHVPTIVEYDSLASFLGGLEIAGGKMKETGTANWLETSPTTTNSSGFSARGGGKCNSSGVMNDSTYCYLWTASELSATNAKCSYMIGGGDVLFNDYAPGKRNGYSLRCVLDSHTIKSVSFYADWAGGTEMWDFSYDPNSNQVTKLDDYWDGSLDKTIIYDYSVAGKLTLMKDGEIYNEFDINAQGNVTKDYESGDEFEYDANGFLIKTYETWSGSKVLHNVITITDGNIAKIETYDDAGVVVKKIKEFTYKTSNNTESIHQANVIDSDWKPIGNFYGKPSAKLVDFFEYWDPRENPVVKNKSTYGYTLDSKNRVSKAVKTLQDNSTEEWEYTY